LGFKELRKGEKATLTCPAEYAYGDRGFPGKVPPNSTVYFDVELLDFKEMDDCCNPSGG